MTQPQRKAVALISGGLDSMLAAKCIQEQGIYVEGINFYTGFCVEGHTHALRHKDKQKHKRNNALWVAEQLGIKLHIIDVVEEYKNVVYNPQFGYGAHLNPCLDCKIFMIQKATQWMQEHQFDFIITGEVIGQRPKSQKKHAMPIVAKHSGAHDLLVRPLSAKFLPETYPEKAGWIDRNQLFDFAGRSRKGQMQLAQQYDFKDYAQPAGGCCFLTNQHYSAKLLDLWQSQGQRHYELDDIMLLKVGRHLRPANNFKLIIGREEGENNYLQGYRHQFDSLLPLSHVGPFALIDGSPSSADILLSARLLARFCDCPGDQVMKVQHRNKAGETTELSIHPLLPHEVHEDWYIEKKSFSHPRTIPLHVMPADASQAAVGEHE